jgi:uncharacterized membrane protein
MYVSSELVGDIPVVLSWLILLLVCGLCLRHGPWRALRAVPERWHLVFASPLVCLGLWLLSVTTIEGLWLHLLGVTSLTLVLGLRLALLVGVATASAYAMLMEGTLRAMPLSWLLSVALPASLSRLLVYLVRRHLPRNLFAYLLGAGFGGGIISATATALAAIGLFALLGMDNWLAGALENWVLIVLIAFPEGFINGTVVAALVVLAPGVLKSFDEEHYLSPP